MENSGILLIAWTRDGNGNKSIMDIVETYHKHANRFIRAWLRDKTICAISADKAGAPLSRNMKTWVIR